MSENNNTDMDIAYPIDAWSISTLSFLAMTLVFSVAVRLRR